jgi:hypothetical protein
VTDRLIAPEFRIKQERHTLSSRHLDHSLMYPGVSVFTWMKLRHMPWMLVSIEAAQGASVDREND